jgi:transposase
MLLSGRGYSMSKIAGLMQINRMTVARLLDAWEKAAFDKRFEVLYRVEGRGAKSKLEPVRDKIPHLLENSDRNINRVPEELKNKYGIVVCKVTLRAFLKDT